MISVSLAGNSWVAFSVRAREGTVGFLVETGGDGFEGGGEEGVVISVLGEEGEAGFDGGQCCEHGRF